MIQPYEGMPPLYVHTSGPSSFYPYPVWYKNFEYWREKERGYEFHEDLFQPGVMEISIRKGQDIFVSASTEEPQRGLKTLWHAEEDRRRKVLSHCRISSKSMETEREREMMEDACNAAGHFPIRSPSGRYAIIAGYHWFSDWGRDTLISVPGLTFCTGRAENGIAILKEMGLHERCGLLPNYFGDDGRVAYNSVDSSLWYFWALQQMVRYTGDQKLVAEVFWPVMKKIVISYMSGTEHKIFMDENGLLHAGDEKTQLTWMDVSIDGKPVTPRFGYAVEINALWYNALCFAHEIAGKVGDHDIDLKNIIVKAKESFERVFWIEEDRYLGDCFAEGELDRAVRPNQIIAVSLPFSAVDEKMSRCVVEKVMEELLTPYGLRTLSPRDAAYRGQCTGTASMRDRAYHQGTVWPWLIGHFGESYLRVYGKSEASKSFIFDHILKPLNDHRLNAGLGFISEIFDGDAPHRPNGCIAQAWSCAEFTRLLHLISSNNGDK